MALPKLEVQTYELTLPSTNQIVKFRPFLVKEYKILLAALESDADEISRIVTELIDVCTFKTLDIEKLAHFDVEYIFLQLRAKSIGEVTNLNISCDCGNKLKFDLNLNDVKVERKDNHSNKIMVTDNLGIIMRYPKFNEIIDIYDNTNSEKVFSLVSKCIETVFDQDSVYKRSDYTDAEMLEFLSDFTKEQFDKLENFFGTMPVVKQRILQTCNNCNAIYDYDLEGLQNFFV